MDIGRAGTSHDKSTVVIVNVRHILKAVRVHTLVTFTHWVHRVVDRELRNAANLKRHIALAGTTMAGHKIVMHTLHEGHQRETVPLVYMINEDGDFIIVIYDCGPCVLTRTAGSTDEVGKEENCTRLHRDLVRVAVWHLVVEFATQLEHLCIEELVARTVGTGGLGEELKFQQKAGMWGEGKRRLHFLGP